jgi:hypothetical protein
VQVFCDEGITSHIELESCAEASRASAKRSQSHAYANHRATKESCPGCRRRVDSGCQRWPTTGPLNRESLTRMLTNGSPSCTQGGSPCAGITLARI